MKPKPITWFEVNTPSNAKAIEFYTNVFGYTAQDFPGPTSPDMPPYKMLTHGDVPFSGTMEMSGPQFEGVPPHWMIYFHTDDIASTIEKVNANGGKVVWGPETMPGVGQMATCTDSNGAHYSIHQPEPMEGEMPEGPMAIDWVENMSPSRETANDYYKATMGWELEEADMGPAVGMYSMFTFNGVHFAGAMKVPDPNIPPNWMVYLVTEDINATCEKIKANGGQVHADPFEVPGVGHISMVADNQGAAFGLHQPPKE